MGQVWSRSHTFPRAVASRARGGQINLPATRSLISRLCVDEACAVSVDGRARAHCRMKQSFLAPSLSSPPPHCRNDCTRRSDRHSESALDRAYSARGHRHRGANACTDPAPAKKHRKSRRARLQPERSFARAKARNASRAFKGNAIIGGTMLRDLPRACDIGTKTCIQGHQRELVPNCIWT